MMPSTEKPKHVRKAPDWIDPEFVKTLPEEKQAYWKNRMEGKNGYPSGIPKAKVIKTPTDIQIGFDNAGQMVAKTRAVRRRKAPTDIKYTKVQKIPKRKR